MPRFVGGDEFVRFQLDSMSSSDCELLRGGVQLGIPCGLATGFPYNPLLDRRGLG